MSQKNFTNATGNWIVSDTGEISYTGTVKVEGDLQATDFLDADGNSIIRADIWVVSDPDQFGVRRVKFPDQISKPGDIYDFMIRYSSDPEQGTMSRGTINAYKIYVKDIEASSIKAPDIIASDSVQSPKVTAELVQSISSTSTKQEVLGSIVIGKIEETESFSEEQKAAAMGLNSALKVVKSYSPAPIPDKVMIDIDKDGNITAKGVVQAADFLDADGNSIAKNVVKYKVDLEAPDSGFFAHSTDLNTGSDNRQGTAGLAVTGAQSESTASIYAVEGANGESTQMLLSNNPTRNIPFEILIQRNDRPTSYLHGKTDYWELNAPKIHLGAPYYDTTCEVIVTGTVKANDFLDADGNSIIGAAGAGNLKSVDDYLVTSSKPLHMVTWTTDDTYDGFKGVFNISWERKSYPDYYAGIRGHCLQGSEGIGFYSGKDDNYAAQHATPFGIAVTVASKQAQFLVPEIVLAGEYGSTSDQYVAVKMPRDGNAFFKYAVKAADFLDSNGNSLPKSATVNNLVTLTQAQYDALSTKDSSTIYFIKEL